MEHTSRQILKSQLKTHIKKTYTLDNSFVLLVVQSMCLISSRSWQYGKELCWNSMHFKILLKHNGKVKLTRILKNEPNILEI